MHCNLWVFAGRTEVVSFIRIEAGSMAFINWLISVRGQTAIAEYRVQGQQLFFPNARKTASN